MGNRVACNCPRCRCRRLMAPVIIITLGVLFLAGEFLRGVDFGDLWPVLLIVIGVVKLIEYSAPLTGHQG